MEQKDLDALLKFLGGRIREVRRGKGLTQEDLGDKAGMNPKYLGYIERGERNITIKNLFIIANALEISIAEMFAPWKSPRAYHEGEIMKSAAKEAHEIKEDLYGPLLSKEEVMKELPKLLARMNLARLNAFYRITRILVEFERR